MRFSLGFGALLLLEIAIAVASDADLRLAALALIGAAIGATLLGANFGFSSAFRRAVEHGDFTIFRAHALMFELASAIIVPLLGAGSVFGVPLTGFATPIGLSFVLGAALFGVGMQMAGGCASGTLYLLGGGNAKFALVLAALILGSVVGAAHIGFWRSLPAVQPITVFSLGSWPLALGAELAAFAAWRSQRCCSRGRAKSRSRSRSRMARCSWRILNVATLLVAGRPWSETFGFALWGSKLAAALGAHPETWAFWQGSSALGASVLTDKTSIMDLSIVIGAFLSGAWKRNAAPDTCGSEGSWVAGGIGGFAMGYGARLSAAVTSAPISARWRQAIYRPGFGPSWRSRPPCWAYRPGDLSSEDCSFLESRSSTTPERARLMALGESAASRAKRTRDGALQHRPRGNPE